MLFNIKWNSNSDSLFTIRSFKIRTQTGHNTNTVNGNLLSLLFAINCIFKCFLIRTLKHLSKITNLRIKYSYNYSNSLKCAFFLNYILGLFLSLQPRV